MRKTIITKLLLTCIIPTMTKNAKFQQKQNNETETIILSLTEDAEHQQNHRETIILNPPYMTTNANYQQQQNRHSESSVWGLSKEQKKSEKNGQLNENSLRKDRKTVHLNERTLVTDNEFAYMVAVLKNSVYVCAGALIDERWVLTAADGLYLMNNTVRSLRIRLGSINYKKGGKLLPVKYLKIHPYFDKNKPTYDLALVMLAHPVWYTPSVKGVRLQLTPKEITATHFIMTSWPGSAQNVTKNSTSKVTKRHRILSVTHVHPSDPEDCVEELKEFGVGEDSIMCLETGVKNTCTKDVGAPIVINGVLWGITSSWKPEECDEEDPLLFATLVSSRNISTWIHATVHGHKWESKNK